MCPGDSLLSHSCILGLTLLLNHHLLLLFFYLVVVVVSFSVFNLG